MPIVEDAMTTPNVDFAQLQSESTTSPSSLSKRKRSESIDHYSSSSPNTAVLRQPTDFSLRLQNALPLLRKADQAPSILNYPLTLNGEPSPKRLKYATENIKHESISARIESRLYQAPESLLEDVDTAARSLIRGLESGRSPADLASARKAVDQINLFKQSLSKVCRHIAMSENRTKPEHVDDEEALLDAAEVISRPIVLTLTGQTERGPKHLYSGLRRRRSDHVVEGDAQNNDDSECCLDLDLRQLPNGISATEASSSDAFDQADVAKQKSTFGEVFRPHQSLKAIEPPRPSRNSTRGSALGWISHTQDAGVEKPLPAYKSDYRCTSLPTGSWLHYSNPETGSTRSPNSKRKQRDRALSFGESRADEPRDTAEQEQAKTSVLFQSVYSSFAPASDNSVAIVPEKTRNHAWWCRTGQKRFQSLRPPQYPDLNYDGSSVASDQTAYVEDCFDVVVDDFKEDAIENAFPDGVDNPANPKAVDDVLQEISDLIQTLSSYQRIRNVSKINSGPATPTTEESDVFDILRSNLVLLIASLPPYAVAKLNGEQLGALNVSTKLVTETKDHAGTLNVDEVDVQRQKSSVAATPGNPRGIVSMGTARRAGNHSAPSIAHGQRASFANTARTTYSNQSRALPSNGSAGTPQKQIYSPARPGPMSSHRAGPAKAPRYSDQAYGLAPNTAPFPRPSSSVLPNGSGAAYGNANHSASSLVHASQRQAQPGLSYAPNRSPQRAGQNPRSTLIADIQRHAQKQQRPPSAGQASPSISHSPSNSITMTEQARAQLQAHRQLASTPPSANLNGQYGRRQTQQSAEERQMGVSGR